MNGAVATEPRTYLAENRAMRVDAALTRPTKVAPLILLTLGGVVRATVLGELREAGRIVRFDVTLTNIVDDVSRLQEVRIYVGQTRERLVLPPVQRVKALSRTRGLTALLGRRKATSVARGPSLEGQTDDAVSGGRETPARIEDLLAAVEPDGIEGRTYLDAFEAGMSREGVINALYFDLLGRPADPAGIDHYIKEVEAGRLTFDGVVQSLISSEEYRHRRRFVDSMPGGIFSDPMLHVLDVEKVDPRDLPQTGARILFDASAMTDEAFVEWCYINLLGKALDEGGRDHYLWVLASEQMDRAGVIAHLRSLPEAVGQRVAILGLDAATNEADAAADQNDGEKDAAQDVDADVDAGVGQDLGGHATVNRDDVIDIAALLSISDDAAFLEASYEIILGKPLDDGGRGHYLHLLAADEMTRAAVIAHLHGLDDDKQGDALSRKLPKAFRLERGA